MAVFLNVWRYVFVRRFAHAQLLTNFPLDKRLKFNFKILISRSLYTAHALRIIVVHLSGN